MPRNLVQLCDKRSVLLYHKIAVANLRALVASNSSHQAGLSGKGICNILAAMYIAAVAITSEGNLTYTIVRKLETKFVSSPEPNSLCHEARKKKVEDNRKAPPNRHTPLCTR